MLSTTPALEVLHTKRAGWGDALGTIAGMGAGGALANHFGGHTFHDADNLDAGRVIGIANHLGGDSIQEMMPHPGSTGMLYSVGGHDASLTQDGHDVGEAGFKDINHMRAELQAGVDHDNTLGREIDTVAGGAAGGLIGGAVGRGLSSSGHHKTASVVSTPALDFLRTKRAGWGNALGTMAGVGLGGVLGAAGGGLVGVGHAQADLDHMSIMEKLLMQGHEQQYADAALQRDLPAPLAVGTGIGATLGGTAGYLTSRPSPRFQPQPQFA